MAQMPHGAAAAGKEPAVEAAGLARDHAGEKALKGVTFRVSPGTLFGIIGADGAGKSTLMDILATLADPDAGRARVLGLDLAKEFTAIRRDIGYMPQRFSLYQDLSVEENLDFFADIFLLPAAVKRERMATLLSFAALEDFRGRRAGKLSGGMKQKLALCCTLIHRPRLILLDEPTVGVDPVARRDFWILLQALRREGLSLLVSTPYMDEAALCDRLILLHQGAILAEGAPAELLAAYPYRLFRVEGGSHTLHYPADRPPPQGFALLYPSAGSLHAAARPGGPVEPGVLLEKIRVAVPEARGIQPIVPTLEDLLFALLVPEGGA